MKTLKIALLVGVMFLLSACDSVFRGPAEITTQHGKVACPDGLRFRGDITEPGDMVICLGSHNTIGNTNDLLFYLKDITALNAQQK
ncbi:MAG: hypothetical protein Q7K26_04700 [bacterium]|nr:hypothetical protein [bacterium]